MRRGNLKPTVYSTDNTVLVEQLQMGLMQVKKIQRFQTEISVNGFSARRP